MHVKWYKWPKNDATEPLEISTQLGQPIVKELIP